MIWRIKRRVIAFRGSLNDVNAVELIRIPSHTRRTGALRLSSPSGEAELFYQKGSLVDVRCGQLEGLEALVEVVGWTKGEFEFALNVDSEKTTIEVDLPRALLEALRIREERQAGTGMAEPAAEAGTEAAAAAAEPAQPAGEPDAEAPAFEAFPALTPEPAAAVEVLPPAEEPDFREDERLRLAEERAVAAERLAELAEAGAREGEERARRAEERAVEAERQALLARERAEEAEERALRAEEKAGEAFEQAARRAAPDPPPHEPDPVFSAYLSELLHAAPFLLHLTVSDPSGRVLAEAAARDDAQAPAAARLALEGLRAGYPNPVRRAIVEDPAGTAVLLRLEDGLSFTVLADNTASLGSVSVAAGKLAARLPRFMGGASSFDSRQGDQHTCQ